MSRRAGLDGPILRTPLPSERTIVMAAETTEIAKESAPLGVETNEAGEFANLLKQSFKPRTERAATEVENAVGTLVREALRDESVIKEDVLDTIEEMIARI